MLSLVFNVDFLFSLMHLFCFVLYSPCSSSLKNIPTSLLLQLLVGGTTQGHLVSSSPRGGQATTKIPWVVSGSLRPRWGAPSRLALTGLYVTTEPTQPTQLWNQRHTLTQRQAEAEIQHNVSTQICKPTDAFLLKDKYTYSLYTCFSCTQVAYTDTYTIPRGSLVSSNVKTMTNSLFCSLPLRTAIK